MKNRFIYPTLKNMLLIFLFLQLIPLVITLIIPNINLSLLWTGYQLAPLGLLIMMPIKPIPKMDEREKFLTIKWQSRVLSFILPCLLIPIFWLAFDPVAKSWTILYSFVIPVYLILLITSLLYKRELGNFYAK
jgi:hypothetical protein